MNCKTEKSTDLRTLLKEIREEQGLSRSAVAERLEVNSTNIRDWEEGLTNPRLDTVIAWAAALGYELDLHKV